MLIRIFFSLFVSFFVLTGFSQTDICEESATGIFWPVKKGIKRHYYTTSGPYVSYFNGDSLKIGNNVYYKRIEQRSSGEDEVKYFREQNGNVYIYDVAKKIEFLELSNNITPGYTWEKYDRSWKYTVIDTTSKISTPYCDFVNLLNIKAEPLGNTRSDYSSYFNLYYKRGVGLVNLSVSGKGYSFLTIDKFSVIEENYTVPGCETLDLEADKNQCTAEKISVFITKNFTYTGKKKKGTLKLQFLITEKGDVENVTVQQSIKNAAEQTEEAIRVVKLMKFIPRKLNGKAYKTVVIIPVDF